MNSIKTLAAIGKGDGTFSIEEIEVAPPGHNEILVEIKAAGVCHTDWDSLSWDRPIVMGHEGAGIVRAIGEGIDHVKVGDAVLLNWAIPCGTCFQCLHGNYSICENHSIAAEGKQGQTEKTFWKGELIERSFSIGTMSGYSVVRKEAVTKINVPISFPAAAIVGCGVMTGYGSVVNAAKVKAGSSVVVIGCGGVGLNVIQGARISGADKIIALDLKTSRLEMAKQFGATHVIQPSREDRHLLETKAKVFALTEGRGADYSFECTGVPALGAVPLMMVRHAGTAIQVSGIEQELTIDMELFEWDKIYMNPLYGKCNPAVDFPKMFRLYESGKLLLDELVTQTYPLQELGKAFDDMLAGKNAKGVLIIGGEKK